MRLLNHTSWSSHDIRNLVLACASASGVKIRDGFEVSVKDGRPGARFDGVRLQIRIGKATAEPLQKLTGMFISEKDLLALIEDVHNFLTHNFSTQYTTLNLRTLPDWARTLEMRPSAPRSKERAQDNLDGTTDALEGILHDISELEKIHAKAMLRLTKRRDILQAQLATLKDRLGLA